MVKRSATKEGQISDLSSVSGTVGRPSVYTDVMGTCITLGKVKETGHSTLHRPISPNMNSTSSALWHFRSERELEFVFNIGY